MKRIKVCCCSYTDPLLGSVLLRSSYRGAGASADLSVSGKGGAGVGGASLPTLLC